MSPQGATLTLLVGPSAPIPAPPPLLDALARAEVTHSDDARSGFQLTFEAGRSGPADLVDYRLLTTQLLKPFNRVILVVTFEAFPRVLMDGIITNTHLSPGTTGSGTLTVTGEDVSVMMDLEEKSAEHPAQDETIIATVIIARYARYGLIPTVIPPLLIDPPIPIERIPVQQATDLEYLKQMADRHGYVFYVKPGPLPLTNTAYWGPPERLSVPQRALSVDMGPETNVDTLTFRNDGLAPTTVSGSVQDRQTNQAMPVETFAPLRPPLAALPSWAVNQPNVRTTQFRESGLTTMQAFARAQGTTDAASDSVFGDGELDATHYGDLLQPRGLVGVRGAGYLHDGLYYVKRVSHVIDRLNQRYMQRFTISREGLGSTTPAVIP